MTEPRIWAPPGSGAPGSENNREPAAAAPPARVERDSPERETEIPLRPLGVSEILDGAITCVRRSPRATLGLSVVLVGAVQVLLVVVQAYVLGNQIQVAATPAQVFRRLGPTYVLQLVEMLFMAYVVLILSGLLAPVTARMLFGRTTSLAQALALARLRLLATATAVLLPVAVPLLPVLLAVVFGASDAVIVVTLVPGILGAVLVLVAAYVWFALATPIAVLEDRGVFEAMRRSAEIVRGRWWRMFGVLALAFAITAFVGTLVLRLPFALVESLILAVDKEPGGWMLVALVAIGALGGIVSGTLVAPFNAGVICLLYADRRMRREAFDLELDLDPADDPVAAWLPGPLTEAGSGPQPRMYRPPMPPPPPGWRR